MTTRNILSALLISGVISLASCQSETDEVVVISTPYGEMTAVLYDETPLHKSNFLKLAKSGKYDSVLFHRVIENFMVQTGDLSTGTEEKDADYKIDAEFVPKYYHIKGAIAAAREGDERNPEKQSSGSQFYIVQGEVFDEAGLEARAERREYLKLNGFFERMRKSGRYPELNEKYNYHVNQYQEDSTYDYAEQLKQLVFRTKPLIEERYGPQEDPGYTEEQKKTYFSIGGTPHLDGEYTVFGKVVEGLEVIDKIAAVSTDSRDRPLQQVKMTVKVVKMPKKEITKKYGFEYPNPDIQ